MTTSNKDYQILIAEDNEADVELTKFFFSKCEIKTQLHFVTDGMEASDFLFRRDKYEKSPKPDLVMLDLNMPRKDGRSLIKEIKADKELCRIPVIMLSTSSSDREVQDCYSYGACAFISKPTDLDKFEKTIRCLVEFFFGCVSLPTRPGKHC